MALSVEAALQRIYASITPKSTELIPVESALGRVLADDLVATYNLPPYDNSAMDGYAVKTHDAGSCVKVIETIHAGDDKSILLSEGTAVKIMTGARIPQGCEAIVPQEEVTVTTQGIVLPETIRPAQHIRLCGEDIQQDDLLLEAKTLLHAHHLTLLASQGISHCHVHKKPRVAVFASGSELKMHYETVASHQLYNTNSPTFLARCEELGCDVSFIGTADDTLESIKAHIAASLDADLIITSGGVSVGDADFTKEAFEAFDMQRAFDKVAIKPGKPTTFGTIGNTLVLNLPGNPLAAALNFELFAHSIILALSGMKQRYLNVLHVKLQHDFTCKSGRRALIPGWYDGEFFQPCKKFAPGMISPLAQSNGIMMIDEHVATLKSGTVVKVIPTQCRAYSNCIQDLVTRA